MFVIISTFFDVPITLTMDKWNYHVMAKTMYEKKPIEFINSASSDVSTQINTKVFDYDYGDMDKDLENLLQMLETVIPLGEASTTVVQPAENISPILTNFCRQLNPTYSLVLELSLNVFGAMSLILFVFSLYSIRKQSIGALKRRLKHLVSTSLLLLLTYSLWQVNNNYLNSHLN